MDPEHYEVWLGELVLHATRCQRWRRSKNTWSKTCSVPNLGRHQVPLTLWGNKLAASRNWFKRHHSNHSAPGGDRRGSPWGPNTSSHPPRWLNPNSALKSPTTNLIIDPGALPKTSPVCLLKDSRSLCGAALVGAYTPTTKSPRRHPTLGNSNAATRISPPAAGVLLINLLWPSRHHPVQAAFMTKATFPETTTVHDWLSVVYSLTPDSLNLTSVKTPKPTPRFSNKSKRHWVLITWSNSENMAPHPRVFHVTILKRFFALHCLLWSLCVCFLCVKTALVRLAFCLLLFSLCLRVHCNHLRILTLLAPAAAKPWSSEYKWRSPVCLSDSKFLQPRFRLCPDRLKDGAETLSSNSTMGIDTLGPEPSEQTPEPSCPTTVSRPLTTAVPTASHEEEEGFARNPSTSPTFCEAAGCTRPSRPSLIKNQLSLSALGTPDPVGTGEVSPLVTLTLVTWPFPPCRQVCHQSCPSDAHVEGWVHVTATTRKSLSMWHDVQESNGYYLSEAAAHRLLKLCATWLQHARRHFNSLPMEKTKCLIWPQDLCVQSYISLALESMSRRLLRWPSRPKFHAARLNIQLIDQRLLHI